MMKHSNPEYMTFLKQHGRSFYWAGLLLGKKHLHAAQRVYAFCRYVDDVVDKADDRVTAQKSIVRIKEDIIKGISDDPIVSQMLALMHDYHMRQKIVMDFLDGVSWDLDHSLIDNEAQLMRYCYGVASTVGLMMCALFQVTDQNAWHYAIDLGIAMQLTNIARDVKIDALMGRIYIPQNWFIKPISAEQILSHHDDELIFEKIKQILALAETYYQSADRGLQYLPFRARSSITVASRIYKAIGDKILTLGCHQYWQTPRVYTTKLEKLLLSLRVLLMRLFRRNTIVTMHDAKLHKHIKDLVHYEIPSHI